MSIAVALDQLRDEIAARGDAAFAVTVGDGGPHVVSVRLAWDGDVLVGGAGSRTAANVAARPSVTLLWPGETFTSFSLLVDGTAAVVDEQLRVTPAKAVLHRAAEAAAAADGPSCVKVLE